MRRFHSGAFLSAYAYGIKSAHRTQRAHESSAANDAQVSSITATERRDPGPAAHLTL